MISELYIENFIIIKKLNIEFSDKFNVITGETGSGKSILIDAMQLLLGSRFQKSFLGKYSNKTIVEGKFNLNENENIRKFINEGYELEDNELIITREIHSNGKTSNKINGRNINLNKLKELMNGVIDIHSQNENQTLLKKENYINLLDSFNPSFFISKKEKIKELLEQKKKIITELNSLNMSEQEIDREKDILNYQLNELEEIDLTNIDEEEMFQEYTKLSNVDEIIIGLNKFNEFFNTEDYNNIDIFSLMNQSVSSLGDLSEKDGKLISYVEQLNEIYYNLQDVVSEISKYSQNLFVDDEKLEKLNLDIEIITNLKRKYGGSINELIEFKKNITNKLSKLENIESYISKTNVELNKVTKELKSIAEEVSQERKKISKKLEQDILKNIKELNMANAKFEIYFKKLDIINHDGFDEIDFLISTNIGQEVKPLSQTASGGELSRIMLGFKTALADVDEVETLVFDEIDTGISGRTAQLVGEKLINISNNRQILVISHLPQIASLADYHLLIDKEESIEDTISNIYEIKDDDRVNEIARLIGGVDINDITLKQSSQMIEQAKSLRESKRK
ncbi:DNA repair protein RecN [Miniphocaeibacter massiliensis]|uniref:DNA repair protein RecN n=1 Tax=Miniphocaeibacter massiliensis TaxID=2041841 RepID=UPI000C075D08|nr:DNA repair protein RecN [Miniphocaeibacter massiliensis]